MKVHMLIEMLKEIDPEREIVMAKDAEGNSYSPLSAMWEGAYRAETTWYGSVGFSELTTELEEEGYGEDDIIDGVPALILCPVN